MRLGSAVLGFVCLTIASTAALAPPAAARSHGRSSYHGHVFRAHYAHLQCVPFARNESGVEITGNANTWWDQADGVYERGHIPEPGSVLSFQGTSRIPLGHVAVVSTVVSAREIEIDHANWGGGIHRNVSVVDVSQRNDWSDVRVEMGQTGAFGSVYPANGFIYDRAAGSGPATQFAAAGPQGRPSMTLNPAASSAYLTGTHIAGLDDRDPMEVEARDPFESFRTPFRGVAHRARPVPREIEEVAELPSRKHRHRRHR